jgi:hypothetical protein
MPPATYWPETFSQPTEKRRSSNGHAASWLVICPVGYQSDGRAAPDEDVYRAARFGFDG